MNIFVTGGTGFVGSNFIDKVLSEGSCLQKYDSDCKGVIEFADKANNGVFDEVNPCRATA